MLLWSATLYIMTQCTPWTGECCGRLQYYTQWPNLLHEPENVVVVCHAVHNDPMYVLHEPENVVFLCHAVHNDQMYSMNLRMLWSSATLYTMTQCNCTPWTWDVVVVCNAVHNDPMYTMNLRMLWSSATMYTMTQCTPGTWECCGRLPRCTLRLERPSPRRTPGLSASSPKQCSVYK